MRFTRSERSAIASLIKRMNSGVIESMGSLLGAVGALVEADHAELTSWHFSAAGDRRLGDRSCFDPLLLDPPLFVLPSDETPAGVEGRTATPAGDPIRTWTTDTAPGWGGPALLSVRPTGPDQLLLLTLRRTPDRAMFSARQAAVVDALNHCHALWVAMEALTRPRPR